MSDIDNAAVSSMPYITMQKTSGILPHCMNVCTILEKELTKREIEELQEKAQQRGKLIQKLAERNLLHSTLLGDPESLPVFIFLMKQLTKKEYLAAVAKNKYPTCRTIYKTIMKASVKNDLETAKIVESYSTGECTGSELRDQLNKICNCKDMSSESENRPVADVISVGTLDRVPDGSNFVCFQSMPSLDTIQKKNLNCAVFKPSRHVVRQVSILVEDFIIGTAAETAYAGRMVVDSQEIVNAINASGSAVVELERNAVNVEILGIQSPKSSTVVTIHVNHFPEVINVYVVVTGPSDDLMSPRGMTRNFKVSGTSSKRVDDGDGPPVDVPLQSFSSEVSDFDNSVQHTMAPTFAVLSQALLRINDAEVAELVRQYTSGQKTAKMFGMDFWAILNNIENVMGVKKVATLGDIPHGSYLVCYGEVW
ncbi:hypothetical protein GCK72_003623 [Caenorhabditis remanei]|uniref:Uncharacterized protein n=1 Tax=Caenorhabditis remanei TaxID=31234 RepID=A0A6A5H7G8_CAERE|nr:hypothetical protein GCK72_003623 [Caenorhabditis remanei]KAF1763678.1 hypothetical protein GCK72_003623 [Caenorhabditis remanei]